MLRPPPVFFRPDRGRRTKKPIIAPMVPVVGLNLVSAVYSEAPSITLSFNQPIDIAGLVYGAIIVTDGAVGVWWVNSLPGVLIDPQTVQMTLVEVKEFVGAGVHLTAPGTTGIVAVNGGGTWGGVTELELPFP